MNEDHGGNVYGSSAPELRLVLLGSIGCGKTASGDTILGQLSPVSRSDASRSCQIRQGSSERRRLTLVEAPRWYWSGEHVEGSVRRETERALTLTSPGPHAFLLLVPVGQFTEVEGRVPAELEEVFGEGVLDHTLVLLTCGDYLMFRTAQTYLQQEDPGLREVIERCGGRYHVLNNRQRHDREQVRRLLEKIEDMGKKNGGYYFKTAQRREIEEQVKGENERTEAHRGMVQERNEAVGLRYDTNADRRIDKGVRDRHGSTTSLEQRRREKEEVQETSVTSVNGLLLSATAPESNSQSQNDSMQVKRSSSFRLNTDGALLSQLSEVKPTEKKITTFHHRINSLEERSSPEASPTSSSPSYSSTLASSPPSSSSSAPEVRLILLGRSGSGKSAAGNIILGQKVFVSWADSLTAVTLECEKRRALIAGRMVSVVDTPDWFQSERTPDEVRAQISSCVALSAPGPHAFLLCVPVDQPARTELQALRALEAIFGPEVVRSHTVVLFTHADRLRESGKAGDGGVEGYIAGQRGDLLKLVEKCMDRFHVMERGGEEERRNVAELLEKVEQTVREAGGGFYSSPAFQEAEDKVRQRQVEIAKEKRGRTEEGERVEDGTKRQALLSSLTEEEEEEVVGEDEIEGTRHEAERRVSTMNLESLPEISLSMLSPSLLRSMWEKVESGASMVPKLLADNSVWEKCQGQKVPRLMANSAARVGSGAKAVAGSPVWEKVGSGARSGAKMVADRVGAGIGTGAKNLAQSPMWGKVGAGAKTGAKMVADGSMRVGAGIGAGAKRVAQSPVWGKVGSGAKIVTESSIWDKVRSGSKKIPMVVVGALLGLMLGVFLGGMIGGAVGATTGSVVTEVGRRKYGKNTQTEKCNEASKHVGERVGEGMESLTKSGEKQLKTE